MEVVASLSQGRTAAALCGLVTHKSVPVIFKPPCIYDVPVVVECWPILLNMLLSACCMSHAVKDFIFNSVFDNGITGDILHEFHNWKSTRSSQITLETTE